MSAQPILVSVIISVQNEGIDLQTTLESMKVSRVAPRYEIIIVDEGSVDGCCDFLMHFKFDMPLRKLKAQRGISSRQLGASHALGEYLIFCSPRLYFEDGWMEALLEPIQQGRADCSTPSFTSQGRPVNIPQCSSPPGGLCASIYSYPAVTEEGDIPWLSWDCFAIRRQTLEELGGLADGFYTKEIETAEFSLRTWLSGRVCYYVPHITLTIVFRHNYPPDHRLAYWGSDLIAFTRIHFEKETVAKIRELVIACDGEQPGAPDREGLEEAREKYLGLRQHDPLWFANRFDITL
ncbi:glycosyltransferase [Paenibacillus sp. FSL W8-0186]|uniref:Glycosyltransferase n=1 Tax=Paenibacillus woosongensis TaxID=307580 RepID=A0A7X3CLB6_9BACL|nr:glycosyltransferase [Paenibacillus woosongensis]MUG43765.1 glycosyltransferase [Paenibacillus woosongensis]